MLDEDLRYATVVSSTQSATDEHIAEHEEETTEEECEQVTALQGSDEQQETDGGKSDEEHALRFLSLLANGLLLNLDDAFCTPSGDGTNTRDVFVVFVRVDQDILQGIFWKKVRHGFGEHRLAGSRVADHQHVSALFSGFLDDH